MQGFEEMLENDFWQYQTQYMNDPTNSGLSEFNTLDVKSARLYKDKEGIYWIQREGILNYDEEHDKLKLSDCDVVMGIDPAFTDKGISAKTSRTAIMLWAMDSEENCYLIRSKVGHFGIIDTFDHIATMTKEFEGYVRKCILESNAAQKALKPLLQNHLIEKDLYLAIDPIPVASDKDVRIRSDVGRILMKGTCWVCKGAGLEFTEEKNIFPQSPFKKDALDASQKAITALVKPWSKTEYEEYDEQEEEIEMNVSEITGY